LFPMGIYCSLSVIFVCISCHLIKIFMSSHRLK
jgi:hypothetical protein